MRFSGTCESQTAQAAGAPSGTTVNGYICALVAASSYGFVLRGIRLGTRAGSGAPINQQLTLALYRQTVRASGTGLANSAGVNDSLVTTASSISGIDVTTATTLGTTGPTLSGLAEKFSFNTQVQEEPPWEMPAPGIEVAAGTANGLALVNIGNALPAGLLLTVTFIWDE